MSYLLDRASSHLRRFPEPNDKRTSKQVNVNSPVIVPTDQYYVRREASRDYTHYWKDQTDPDGVLRHRLSKAERTQYLDDVAIELQFVSSLPPGRILDVGCGPGWFLSQLEGDWEIYGTEPQADARREAEKYGVKFILSQERHDVVRCHHVIEHMEFPLHELHRMHHWLNPNGWLLLSTPDFGSPCARRFGDRYRMLHDETHCSLFTRESLIRMLRDHGFEIDRIDYPFPDRYATEVTMERWRTGPQCYEWSPPWPGNVITVYARKQ